MPYPQLAHELSGKIDDFLEGNLSREEFRSWFVPVLWGSDEFESDVARLIYDVELAFAEIDNGSWSWSRFERELEHISRRARRMVLT